jgi:ABC-type nitrate/sulfonate/bicarbonate transport system ATPase subunit
VCSQPEGYRAPCVTGPHLTLRRGICSSRVSCVAVEDPASSAKLELRQLHKSYSGDQGPLLVLAGIDLVAHEGEFVSVIGPSGCGKSSLLEVVAGLQAPDQGEVLVDGVRSAGARCAYMPQKDLLFPWRRVIDNVTLGLEVGGVKRAEARAQVAPLLDAFGLAGFEGWYPFQLSGGMRQRAALLRTVVQQRSLLLLDEPLGALDSLTRTDMQVWMESVWERYRWTVLLVTHDIREAIYLSDTVYVLSDRPARVIARAEVGLPRPRSLGMITAPEVAELEVRLLANLREGKALC